MLVPLLARLVDISSNIGWIRLWIERAHSSKQSAHHCHGMCIVSEGFDEWFKSLVVARVLHDLFSKGMQLFFSWQLAIDDQECHFEEA